MWRFLVFLGVLHQHIFAFKFHRDLKRGYTALETIVKRGIERVCDDEADSTLSRCKRPLVRLSGDRWEGDIHSKVTHAIADQTGLSLDEAARRLRDEIRKETDYVSDCTISSNGYINVTLRESFIRQSLSRMLKDPNKRLNIPYMTEERIVIDYFSPNVGKDLHMGHLRSAAVGGAIANILEFCGSKVMRRSHVGDFGAQSGQIIRYLVEYDPTSLEAFNPYNNDWKRQVEMTRQKLGYSVWNIKKTQTSGRLAQPTPSLCRELISNTIGEIYKLSKEIYNKCPDFVKRCKEETTLLQQGKDPHQKVWQHIAVTSMRSYRDMLEKFKLDKVRDIPESYYSKRVFALVERLVKEGHANKKPDGSVTIVLKEFNNSSSEGVNESADDVYAGTFVKGSSAIHLNKQPAAAEEGDNGATETGKSVGQHEQDGDAKNNELVLITKEGALTYLAVDLTAMEHRIKENKADRLIYVTDNAQGPHFKRVEIIARQVGILTDQKMEHVGFGSVNASDGKRMRSRSGVVDTIESIWEDTVEVLKNEVGKNVEYIGEMRDFMAKKLATGSILYADLSTTQRANYTFSTDRLINLGGNSLIGILYSYARGRAINRKVEEGGVPVGGEALEHGSDSAFRNPSSRKLAMTLMGLEDTILSAVCLHSPHRLCKYIWSLSKEFAHFYQVTKVIEGDVANAESLDLVNLVSQTIKFVLNLLNIETVERL
ncbi:arginyl-tRNA synthetase [Babesia gibsoni]|uniref:arginine--tRNA ligase n=1 Tax=Babesia gibsoni TaxID=33632 RepID=A0AAD8PD44_BABGI|nr:arginyl-tRNA synthetase [Babesia gibsoni]